MFIQKSYNSDLESGVLYLVGTPIGNLDDMTFRAIKILNEVDLIAAEDTRHTIRLLNHFNIHKKLISYHEHNKISSGEEIIKILKLGGKIALVSDAGMPAISDPGYELVKEAVKNKITVIPIPGANAAITGLVASGLETDKFIFIGFLPRDKKPLKEELMRIKSFKETMIFYEAPHRIEKTLITMSEILGNRNITLIRELSKKHEEFIRGCLVELIEYIQDAPLKGEITLIIEGANNIEMDDNSLWWAELSLSEHVDHYVSNGYNVKEAIKITSLDRKIQKREVYQDYHNK